MKNSIIKKIFLALALISLSIMLAIIPVTMRIYNYNFGLGSSYMQNDKKIIEKDFYKSNTFDYTVIENIFNIISNTVIDVESRVDDYINSNTEIEYEEYTDENGAIQTKEIAKIPTKEEAIEEINNSIERSKEEIRSNYPGIQFIAVNKDKDIVYSNTEYETVEEFKKNVDEDIDIELIKKSHYNGSYKKDIEGNIYTNNKIETITALNIVENKQIEVYMSFPRTVDESSWIYTYMNEYNKSIKYIEVYGIIASVSLVVFLLSVILYKLIKIDYVNEDGILIKITKKVPLEFWIVALFFILIFTRQFLTSYYYGYSYWIEKICGAVGTFIIITLLYLQIYVFKRYDNKLDYLKNTLIYKFYNGIKMNIVKILNSSKKIPLIKQIIIIAILLAVANLFVTFILILFGFGVISFVPPIFLSIGVFTWYTVKKLSYLAKIMEGAEKIKNGDLHYKIDIEGYNCFTDLADNINNIGEGLEKSIDKQLKSERLRSELITNVSHDLKTPLTSIINYIELIKNEDDIQPEVLKDYVNVLDTKSKRLKSLIEDLFEASKASSGNIDLNMDNIDIKQLLNQSVGELEEKLNSSNLELKVNVPKEKIYIYADGRRMFRVFENLLSNIAKYSLPNTRVYIDIVEENENIKLTMKNISSYELNFDASEITERFKRGDESRNTEGSGLGLAIAKDLVRLQNGKFDIDIDGDLFKVILEFRKSEKKN